jgi:hypothetical protein
MGNKETTFENVNVPTIEAGAETATLSGKLLQKDGSGPVVGADIAGSVKAAFLKRPLSATATTKEKGEFDLRFDTSSLRPGSHKYEIRYGGNPEAELDGITTSGDIVVNQAATAPAVPPQASVTTPPAIAGDLRNLTPGSVPNAGQPPAPSTEGCVPCTDLISTVKRVLRDPKVNQSVSDYIRGKATGDVKDALNNIADAVAGCDAIQATGPSCTTAIQLEIFLWDALNNKIRQLERDELEGITVRLLENGALAAGAPSFEDKKVIFRSAFAGFGGFLSAPSKQFALYNSQAPPPTVSLLFSAEFAAHSGIAPIFKRTAPGGTAFSFCSTAPQIGTSSTEQDEFEALESKELKQALAVWGLEAGKTTVTRVGGLNLNYLAGAMTQAQCLLIPQLSQVRCLSVVEGDPCCLQGAWVEEECRCGNGCSTAECRCEKSRQYISGVSIAAFHEGIPAGCHQTGKGGCSGFELAPGWYQFTAPEEVQIYGCNYSLCTPSPISAFLGARQSCSDLFFTYRKKGAVIEVISEILYPDPTNPYVEARNNLAGMSYLLLREGDSSFAPQQQTTADGGALRFENVPVGTYLLFCQGPATYDSQPVEPLRPENGRMALRVFGGQTHSKIPVLVKFRQSRTTPATLTGYVRDDTGQPIPSQVVQVLDHAGRVIAAGLTDTSGFYSIQIYKAENVTLAFGPQQFAVAKAQIQAAMMTTGPARLPSPMRAMDTALESAEILGTGR